MIFDRLGLGDTTVVRQQKFGDHRGFFARMFCADEFAQAGLANNWLQINNSLTGQRGTVRGMHFQRAPSAEVKLVRCIKGAIFDVAVDVRKGSPTFGQWRGIELTADSRDMLYVPQGFAHGFQALTDDAEIIYFNTAFYAPEIEGGVHHADPDVGVSWPLAVAATSDRDEALPSLKDLVPVDLG